jgi:hypothetical protein
MMGWAIQYRPCPLLENTLPPAGSGEVEARILRTDALSSAAIYLRVARAGCNAMAWYSSAHRRQRSIQSVAREFAATEMARSPRGDRVPISIQR